jgi:hypothetical protein
LLVVYAGWIGLGRIEKLVPFHSSATVVDGAGEPPTAKHFVVLRHDTPLKKTPLKAGGLGLGTIDQLLASHLSANVEGVASLPTAKQLCELGHVTPCRSLVPVRLGLATPPQLLPFHRSTNVFDVEPGEEPLGQ